MCKLGVGSIECQLSNAECRVEVAHDANDYRLSHNLQLQAPEVGQYVTSPAPSR